MKGAYVPSVVTLVRIVAANGSMCLTSSPVERPPKSTLSEDKLGDWTYPSSVSSDGVAPRNTIRICKEILDQQSEIDCSAHALSLQAIVRGFDVFAKNYTNEIFDEGIIRDLQKMRRADFHGQINLHGCVQVHTISGYD